MASPFDEAISLFQELAKINRLLYEAQSDSNAQKLWGEALRLIEKNTINVKWWTSVRTHLPESFDKDWKIDALNRLNSSLISTSQIHDPIERGIVYIRCGHYAEAQKALTGTDLELIELCSHLNTFLGNWTYIKHLSVRLSSSTNCTLNTEVIINAALAHFCLREYRNCAAMLLRLNIGTFSEARNIWHTPKQVQTLFVYAVLLGLNPRELKYFHTTDNLAKIMMLESLLNSYREFYDLKSFWKYLTSKLAILPVGSDVAQADLHDKLICVWLTLYNKIPLKTILDSSHIHDEFDLAETLDRLNLPYRIDLVNGWVELCSVPPPDSYCADQRLSNEYNRDLAISTWAKQNDKYINSL